MVFFHEWKNLQHNFSCQILSWKDNVLKLGFWIKKLCCGFFHSFHSWKNTTKQQWSMRPKVFWISDQTLWLRVSVLCTVGLLKPISLFHFTFFSFSVSFRSVPWCYNFIHAFFHFKTKYLSSSSGKFCHIDMPSGEFG